MSFLTTLGEDVDSVVRLKPANRKARVRVYHANAEACPKVPMVAKGTK